MNDDGNNFRSLELDAAEALQHDADSGQDPICDSNVLSDSNIFQGEMQLDGPVQDGRDGNNNNNNNNNNNSIGDTVGDDDITASEMYMYTRFVNSLATADVPKSEDLPFLQGAPVLDPHQLTSFFHGFQSPHPDMDTGLDVLEPYHRQHGGVVTDTTITTSTASTTTTTAAAKRHRSEPNKVRVTIEGVDPLNDEIGNLISMSGTSSSGTRSSTAPTSISSPDSTVLSTPASFPGDPRLVARKHTISSNSNTKGNRDSGVGSHKEVEGHYSRHHHHHHHHHHRHRRRRDSDTIGNSGNNIDSNNGNNNSNNDNDNDNGNDSKTGIKTNKDSKTKVKTKVKTKTKAKAKTQTQTQNQTGLETGTIFKNYDIHIPGKPEPHGDTHITKTNEINDFVNSKTHSVTSGLTEDDEILKELTFAGDIRGPEVHVNPLGEPNKISETPMGTELVSPTERQTNRDKVVQSSASDGLSAKNITASASTEQPYYVNPKQYYRILKRRYARAKLEESLKITKDRKPYLHESRHKHAMRRPRGQGGRFLTAAEIKALKERESQQKAGEGDASKKSSTGDNQSRELLETKSTTASSSSTITSASANTTASGGNKGNEIKANIKVEEMKVVSEGGIRQHTTESSPRTTVTPTTGASTVATTTSANSATDAGSGPGTSG